MTVARTLTYNQDHEKQKPLPAWVFEDEDPTHATEFRPLEQLDVPEHFHNDSDLTLNILNDSSEQDELLTDASLSPKLLKSKPDPWDADPNPVLADLVSNLQNNNLDILNEPPDALCDINQHLRKDPDNDNCYLLLSTNLVLKKKCFTCGEK